MNSLSKVVHFQDGIPASKAYLRIYRRWSLAPCVQDQVTTNKHNRDFLLSLLHGEFEDFSQRPEAGILKQQHIDGIGVIKTFLEKHFPAGSNPAELDAMKKNIGIFEKHFSEGSGTENYFSQHYP